LSKIRAGIYGYGNIARGIEAAILKNTDFSLEAVFTRRDPSKVKVATKGVKAVAADKVLGYKDRIDVMFLCGGSATDLPAQAPELAKHFNIIDSYDTHAKIPEYLETVDRQAKLGKKAAVISVGWDPGLFSSVKALLAAILPDGKNYAFWGPGVSQGHGDAIRRIKGVAGAVQYTVPVESVVNEIRNGSVKEYTVRQKNRRVCYVAAEAGADRAEIERSIKEMPYYFSEYDVEVHFVSLAELEKEHSKMAHAGHVFRNGETSAGLDYSVEFSIKFGSNPEFTGSIMTAYARAALRLYNEKNYGAKTALDIPPSYLSPKDRKDQVKEFL